jgi:TonB-linked SusC/RagA family outer membrane protein
MLMGLIVAMLCLMCQTASAADDVKELQVVTQTRTIKGKVLDENGDPMIGVSVQVKGTSVGTITDMNGRFSINVPDGRKQLEVSYMGYTKQTVAIPAGKNQIEVNMSPDENLLDEVVVVGYGSQRKVDISGSVVSITKEELVGTPTSDIMEALQGKIAGADIMMSSGAVGSSSEILLRGSRSINGSNSPLIIIDGVQGASEQDINPNDVESISVLKDASSTAIYGSAGANGVIIITTKRGAAGKIQVNLDAKYSISGGANFIHGMTGDEYMQYRKELYRTQNGAYPEDISQLFSSEAVQQAIANNQWIDWIDEATKGNASQKDINLSLRGGSDKLKIYTSINYNNTEGLLTNENQTKYGIKFNADYEIRKWAKIGTSTSLTYTIKNSRGKNIFTKSLTAFPLGEPYDANGNINVEYIEGETSPFGDEIENQYANETRTTYANISAYLELNPIKGLSFRSQISPTLSNSRNGQYVGTNSLQGVENGYSAPYSYINNSYSYSYLWDNILTYDFDFKKDHKLTVTGITSWQKSQSDTNNMRSSGQPLDSYLFYNMASGITKYGVKSNYAQTQKMSYALRFNYSYKDKYIASFTTRWDGASHLAEGHKWESFPAGALAWRVTQEPFMKPIKDYVSNLKLRASYGVTGNSGGMGAYSSQTGAATYSAVSIDGVLSSMSQLVSPYGNPSIGWEKTYQWNYGFDLGLFKGRVNIDMDFYKSRTKDLLFSRTLPVTSAITAWGSPMTTWQNIGETSNKGYEIQLSTVNVRTKGFEWTSSISFTHNDEKIVSLPDGDLIAKCLFEGYPIKTFYNYKYAGIWSTDEAEEAAKYGCQPGYVKIATVEQFTTDENGNTVGDGGVHTYSNTRDLQILGSNVPDGIFGFNNRFTYKGFDLSVFAIIRYGQMIESKAIGWYTAGGNNQPAGVDYWTPENQGAYFPRPGIASTTGIESLRYVDGSYAKIKNITLGYTCPKKVCKALGLQKCRVYATAYNVFVLPFNSALKNTDPENNGSDSFPLYKTFLFGLNLSF